MAPGFHQVASSHFYGYYKFRSSSTGFRMRRPSWRIGESLLAGSGRHRNSGWEHYYRVDGSIRRHGKIRSVGSAYSSGSVCIFEERADGGVWTLDIEIGPLSGCNSKTFSTFLSGCTDAIQFIVS